MPQLVALVIVLVVLGYLYRLLLPAFNFLESIGWAPVFMAIAIFAISIHFLMAVRNQRTTKARLQHERAIADRRQKETEAAHEEQKKRAQKQREENFRQREAEKVALAQHKKELLEKYGDLQTVDRILGNRIWLGQTQEQLIDSLGQPEDIDVTESIRTRREEWKYESIGVNRYALRITLKHGVVAKIQDRR